MNCEDFNLLNKEISKLENKLLKTNITKKELLQLKNAYFNKYLGIENNEELIMTDYYTHLLEKYMIGEYDEY